MGAELGLVWTLWKVMGGGVGSKGWSSAGVCEPAGTHLFLSPRGSLLPDHCPHTVVHYCGWPTRHQLRLSPLFKNSAFPFRLQKPFCCLQTQRGTSGSDLLSRISCLTQPLLRGLTTGDYVVPPPPEVYFHLAGL